MTNIPLTAAEAYVLLDPGESTPAETFKIGFLSLVATRVLKIGTVEKRGLFGVKIVPSASVAGAMPRNKVAADIVGIVSRADTSMTGAAFPAIARSAVKTYGPGLSGIKSKRILPALIGLCLLTAESYRVAWIIKQTRYHHTPDGFAEKQRIDATLDRARRLPALLKSNPAEAKAIILAAGPLLLLAPELKGHYGKFANLGAASVPDAGGGGDTFFEGNSHHGSDAHGHFGGVDFGSFDFGSFDASALDMDFGSFDASFDSSMSDSGGDGGSDGGGGHH